ncbi:D-alanine--D-alanyl carrier protein ligase [Paraburkholderia aspalathi]|jgi:acyl-CoA synthetase (AMP-forming)/AMP-acid ligase II/3-hydroxymyristoyl/3-hydroxydecanoyl-(acyl carrier protein) dehydratase|uniref:AMP-binding protein n=1 Tax=Paraburkholderia aspalathi TaxID=1324617 RepID=UPI00190D8CC2|nr:AMP-binding protein [Paraburkholderia aspalathi]MBK3836680.1 AMP-binding protein [Paraburkholderia aspalathi]CAE6686050.1 D-alanine--D-alanyl carrier protein ligase [Paraburkholderia aspalathi]CAE6854349.1 D-alanine--D-alanyl carrier protein ligase [Paraburkholderia aspalathi]
MIALHDLLSAGHGAAVVNAPVCRDGATVLDRTAFRARVSTLVTLMQTQDARRYALCIDDPFDFACALFALFACGKEPVIPANATPGYLADLADAYDAVLTDADLPLGVRDADADALHTIDPQAPLTLYTSGSSGAPKPIRKTLAQFNAEVHTLEKQWGALVGDATMLASVPHHHIYGLLFRVLWPLAAGRAFDRAISIEPVHLQAQIEQCGATVVVSTPAQLSRWPALPGFAALTPAPRAFFSSGGPLALEAAQEYAAAYGAAPLEIYGSTETGGIAWRRQDQTDAWQPVVGIEVRRDEDGALNVRSPHLDHTGWHRTDDKIAFDADGRFRLQGRLDRVLKLDGKRVSLPELEARLALHPYVAQAAIVPLEGASRERVGAVVALTEAGCEALRDEGRVQLARTLRRHLAAYFDVVVLPRHWRFRLTLPFDARGKLPVAAVAAAFEPRADGVEVLAEARSADMLHYELRVPPTLVHFAGHFPGLPILPGVVQVHWAMHLAAEHVPAVRALASVDRLKFMAPVPPGAVLNLTLAHDAARGRVQFAYRLSGRECASGVIVYREPA